MKKQQGHAHVIALWAVALVMGTMALISWDRGHSAHAELVAMQQDRQRILNTPMVEAAAVTLDAKLVAAYKAAGIRHVAVEPIGTSYASYFVVVNGQVLEDSYSSRVHSPEQMYRLDLSGERPRVWVTHSIQSSWEPNLVSFVLEREMEEFLQARAQQAARKTQWAVGRTV